MRIRNASTVLAGAVVMVAVAVTPAGAARTTTLPAPSVAGVLAVQKQAMADGAPSALTRIDSSTSRYRISPGKADTASGTAMDADRRFRVGSVTESFTTVVLM